MSETLENKRLPWLDILKGIGIILVVFGHVYRSDLAYAWVYSFHMPLFFFASGWLYKKRAVPADIRRRFQTIVVPYFCFGILVLLYWQLFERRFRESDMSFLSSVLGLFSGEYRYLDFNVHLWFLPCFFLTVVLFNALTVAGGKKLAYAVSALMSVAFILLPLPALPWGLDWVFKYIAFFALGTVASDAGLYELAASKRKILVLGTATVLTVMSVVLAYFGLTKGVLWFIAAGIGITSTFLLSVAIGEFGPLQYLGRISLVILCVHGPVYRVLAKLFSILMHTSTEAVRSNAVITAVIVLLTLLICAAIYEVAVRVFPPMVGRPFQRKRRAGATQDQR